MTDDLSLDPATVNAQLGELRDPWLQRRKLSFGASEIGGLALALGWPAPEGTPQYVHDQADDLFASKADPSYPVGKANKAAARGNAVELPIMERFNQDNPWTPLTHSTVAPKSWFPLIDRNQPKLSCTPDSWCVFANGHYMNAQIKATFKHKTSVEWFWHAQVQAEMAVTGADVTLVVVGNGWIAEDSRWHGPVVGFRVERNEAIISAIRQMVADGWHIVEELKNELVERKAKGSPELRPGRKRDRNAKGRGK